LGWAGLKILANAGWKFRKLAHGASGRHALTFEIFQPEFLEIFQYGPSNFVENAKRKKAKYISGFKELFYRWEQLRCGISEHVWD
jgi:hypothetical protein